MRWMMLKFIIHRFLLSQTLKTFMYPNRNLRIKSLTSTMQECIIIIAEGNPGAVTAMMHIIAEKPKIDPDAFDGGALFPLDMDQYGFYGSQIWILWKDVCKQEAINLIALLRANQLGQLAGITGERIQKAVAAHNARPFEAEEFDFPTIIAAVKERLPKFGGPSISA